MHKKIKVLPKTIRGKITAVTAIVTLLITLVTVSICFSVFQSFLRKNQVQASEFSLQVVATNIETDMKNIIYFNKWCRSNPEIREYLEEAAKVDPSASPGRLDKSLRPVALSTYERLKKEYMNTNFITRVLVSTPDCNNFLLARTLADGVSINATGTIRSMPYFQELLDAPDFLWIGLVDDPYYKIDPGQILPMVRPIYNEFNSKVIGWVYMGISSKLFTDYLKPYPLPSDSTIFFQIAGKNYCYDGDRLREQELNYTMLRDEPDMSLSSDTTVTSIKLEDGSKRLLVKRPIKETDGWTISQVISQQQLGSQNRLYQLLIAVICIVILSLGISLTVFLNGIISRPVNQIRRKIDDISQGDFSADPSIEWDHELGEIGKGINRLSHDVVTLMDKRISDERQKKDLEYQILQSQINPHFLYNTLNSIKWMATIQNAAGIAEMTTSLARLMKNVSKGSAALITLKEELDLVKDYFLIQQYRYGGSLTIDYQIGSEDLYACKIHRFTLQPIIENALFHGIEPKGTAGKILVKAEADDSGKDRILRISVTDNGVGMTPELIEQVLGGETESKADFFKQVGINNVNQRIRHDFGDSYGITIQSEPGLYTTMMISIPYMTDENID